MYLIYSLIFCILSNSFVLLYHYGNAWWRIVSVLLFVLLNVLTPCRHKALRPRWLRACVHGNFMLRAFVPCVFLSVIIQLYIIIFARVGLTLTLISILVCILANSVVFWNGMISVYFSSVQLGIRHRTVGLLLGLVPVLNIVMLFKIIGVTNDEISFETQKLIINRDRAELAVCKTRYPILFVHGVFFRDTKQFNYWGRIPNELIKNGATVYYGNHPSAMSVEDSARELAVRIKEIVSKTGCEKVNVIAHSKGGLDCRYACAHLDAAPYVASLITVNTPHRGCEFVDYFLTKIPESAQQKIAATYNKTLSALGDRSPDFIAAVKDLTAQKCTELDNDMPQSFDGIYCRSIGSKLKHAASGKFPLNFTYLIANRFSGANDGLVAESSFSFGEYTCLSSDGDRGISHGDVIDLNRENIKGFDVREFYVGLVNELKRKGL